MLFAKGSTEKARKKTIDWLRDNLSNYFHRISLGMPEFDDRLIAWRVPIKLQNSTSTVVGEVRLNAELETIIYHTKKSLIIERIEKDKKSIKNKKGENRNKVIYPAAIPNKVVLGDCIEVLEDFPPDTAQLVFTSPPYYNAKPEYSEYLDYQEYLDFIRKTVVRCHSVLSEGRFFVINVSPVLIRRTSRSTSSRRLAIPFDFHKIIESAGFEFIDDIIWVKPEGAGWNLGRGRRFRADRKPLQYKPVPVSEYVLVYRKKTDKLIDWNIRKHYDQKLVEESRIKGEYDVTNVWYIPPSSSKYHPATFPEVLVKKVIQYYSFKDDLVLDPFAGIGTVGIVAYKLGRRFLLIDNEPKYFKLMRDLLNNLIPPIVRVDFDIHENFKKTLDSNGL